jgi:heme exporter protein B
MTGFNAVLGQSLKLAWRVGGGALLGLLFFLAVVIIMPFAVGPELKLLARIGPAILWIGALLATLLGLDRLFQSDLEDGTLDVLHLSPLPLELAVFAKGLGHWIATGLPLVIGAPVFSLFLNLDGMAIAGVTLTLLVGTPALVFIGIVGSTLMVALQRGGMLLSILVLPLTIPVLIFGVSAANALNSASATLSAPFATPFLILCALSLISLVVGPIAGAAALRLTRD